MSVKYRMYIDEVGNSDEGASLDANHRYLSLQNTIEVLQAKSTGMEENAFHKNGGPRGPPPKAFAFHLQKTGLGSFLHDFPPFQLQS